MPHRLALLATIVSLMAFGAACGGDDGPVDLDEEIADVPEFYGLDGDLTAASPELTLVADESDDVNEPNDLAFHPADDRADELWVLNEDSTSTGGSTVTLFDAGTADQTADWIRDGNAWHFMSKPTSLAFADDTGKWATGTGVQDANHAGESFAGPSLWSSDFEIYGEVGDPPSAETNGSHLDMLHGSPFSMGIAHEVDNVYWVFDGDNGYIVRYDFHEPHPPGGHDHSDGRIHRYKEVEIERHDSLPSHMIVDKESGWLYVNDTGNQRMIRLDVDSGETSHELPEWNEPLAEHEEIHEADWEVFVDDGLDDPSGMALADDRLFVSNHGTGEIIAFDVDGGDELDRIDVGDGIRGITTGPDGHLWLADYEDDEILRVDPR